ncbi:MAG: hypothetical protein V3V13_12125 [Paracoccaceae bacterium]
MEFPVTLSAKQLLRRHAKQKWFLVFFTLVLLIMLIIPLLAVVGILARPMFQYLKFIISENVFHLLQDGTLPLKVLVLSTSGFVAGVGLIVLMSWIVWRVILNAKNFSIGRNTNARNYSVIEGVQVGEGIINVLSDGVRITRKVHQITYKSDAISSVHKDALEVGIVNVVGDLCILGMVQNAQLAQQYFEGMNSMLERNRDHDEN